MQDDHKPSTQRSALNDGSRHPAAASDPLPGADQSTPASSPSRSPGDDAAPGTVGTGEDVCTRCAGTGKLDEGRDCPDCEGTGIVIQGIGGG